MNNCYRNILKFNIYLFFPLIILVIFIFLVTSGCSSLGLESKNYYLNSKNVSFKKKMIIMPFDSNFINLKGQAREIELSITKLLDKRDMINLVNFDKMLDSINFIDISTNNIYKNIITVCRELGINILLNGVVNDLSVHYRPTGFYGFRKNTPFLTLEVQLSLIDINTGITLDQKDFKSDIVITHVNAEKILDGVKPDIKIIDSLVIKLAELSSNWVIYHIDKLEWIAYIMRVEGDKVKINIGYDSGLNVNSILVIHSINEKIKVANGYEIIIPGPMVGLVRLKEVGLSFSWAEIINCPERKNIFLEGQLVRVS